MSSISPVRSSVLFVSILVVCFCVGAASAQTNTRGLTVKKEVADESQTKAYENRYALVIGVDHYADLGLPDLKYAVSDADAISQVLIDTYHFPEENVTVLRNDKATRTRILGEMQRYIADPKIEEDSQFLFFFAGHGETIRNQIGFILPHDVDLENLVSSGIRMNEIRDVASAMKSKHALFLMDACYGGLTAMRSNPRSEVMLRNALSSKARQLITAGSAEEQVIEAAEYNHSAFTFALLDALGEGTADGNNDGIITALELATKIQQDVPFYADVQGGKQTPQYTKLTPDAGDFLFIRDESAIGDLTLRPDVIKGDQDEIAKSFQKRLRVRANVENARIFINDAERDYLTNNEKILSLPAGVYKVGIKKERHDDVTKEVVISPRDSIVTLDFELQSTYAAVNFDIEPADAIVYVDEDYVGAGTFWEYIPKGRKRIEVSKEGYAPDIRTANITQDTLHYEVRLELIEATLNLTSFPLGALVVTETDTLGVTPVRDVKVPYGSHSLTLIKDDYDEYRMPLEVTESVVIDRTVELYERAEIVAKRAVRKQRMGHFQGFLMNGALAGAAFVGHTYAQTELDGLDEDANDSDRQPYQIAKYAALGISGAFALTAITRLFKLALVDYDATLREEMQRRQDSKKVALGADVGFDGSDLKVAMRLRF